MCLTFSLDVNTESLMKVCVTFVDVEERPGVWSECCLTFVPFEKMDCFRRFSRMRCGNPILERRAQEPMEQLPARKRHQSWAFPPTHTPNLEPPTAVGNDGLMEVTIKLETLVHSRLVGSRFRILQCEVLKHTLAKRKTVWGVRRQLQHLLKWFCLSSVLSSPFKVA